MTAPRDTFGRPIVVVTGMGIEAQYGVGKIAKAPLSVVGATAGDLVDWGVVTGFVSGVANA